MDYATAMMLWATEASTLAVLMIGAWIHDRRQTVTGIWGLGFALHGIGIALIGLRGLIPEIISILVGNGLMLIGIAAWSNGVLLYDGRRMRVFPLIPLAAWLAALLVPVIMESFWTRSVVIQLAAGAGYLILAAVLINNCRKQPTTRLAMALVSTIQASLMAKMAYDCFHFRPTSFLDMPNLTSFAVGNIFCLVAGILLGAQMLMTRSQVELQRLADSDPLTGVFNRRGLLDRFNQLCRKATSAKSQVAIVLFDLDHFKQINDRYGHKAGDIVLMEFCRIATSCLGERGIFGRMGGEEFACVMQVGGPPEAIGVTEAIRLTLDHSEIAVGDGTETLSVTVSCGIALAPIVSANLDAMLIRADRALYAAKSAGRNVTALASGLEDEIQVIGPGAAEPVGDDCEATVVRRPALVPITGGRT